MKKGREKTRIGLTDAGRTVLRGTGFVALAALIIPAFGVLSALVSVLVVALIIGYALRPRIRVSGDLPERVVAGQEVKLTYVLTNIARLPVYGFKVRMESLPETIEQIGGPVVIPHLGSGETSEVTLTIRPRRRGHFRINTPVCESSFPFNLFSFAAAPGKYESFIVLPVFFRLQFPARHLGRHVSSGGTRLAGIAGVFPEYAGNRPFVAGDSPRSIDSRAWARLASPATKEYHDDFDNHTAIVLDTAVPEPLRRPDSGQIKEFEAAVSLCASVALTINNDCLIDMMLTGPDLHVFDGQPRGSRLDNIHEILAGVEPQADCNLEHVLPILTDRLYEVSEVIFVLLDWTETHEELLEKATGIGCHCTVLIIDGTDRMHGRLEVANRAGNIRLLSCDDILKGRVGRL